MDGEPVNFPVIEQNLKMFFPDLDPNNPPDGFARVVRSSIPEITGKKIIEGVSYELSDHYTALNKTTTYLETYHLREITFQEKIDMIQQYRRMNPEYENWIYDEELESLIPPIPKPEDSNEDYVWIFPDKEQGETEGKWVRRRDVVPMFENDEFSEIVETMKDLGIENDVLDEAINSMIDSIKPTTEVK